MITVVYIGNVHTYLIMY